MSPGIAIRVTNLSKCYQIYHQPQDRLKQVLWRGRKQFYHEFWALRDVSFEVVKGEAVGIIGRNGSGKSTLLQMIAGTLTATNGDIEVNGRVAALLELGSGFNPEFTGRENVYLNGTILGLTRKEIDQRFDEIVAFADIDAFIDQPVKTYSSGMVVRLAFSISVCVEPDILIVDEALSVGDMAFQAKCMARLEKLTQSGTTLLFVSHDAAMIKAFCQRVVYLTKGQVRAAGAASDMVELYMLDLKDEQKRAMVAGSQVTRKPALAGGNALAFGTNQGRVLRACFGDSGSMQSAFSTGEPISVEVEVEFDATLDKPAVSIVICDYRLIEIAGRYLPVAKQPDEQGLTRTTVRFSLLAALNAGNYFVTVRLEERISENNLMPVDKQVGALSFNVFRPGGLQFVGLVHIPIDACETGSCEAVR